MLVYPEVSIDYLCTTLGLFVHTHRVCDRVGTKSSKAERQWRASKLFKSERTRGASKSP